MIAATASPQGNAGVEGRLTRTNASQELLDDTGVASAVVRDRATPATARSQWMNTTARNVRHRPAVWCAPDPERMFLVNESGRGQPPTAGERAAGAVCTGCPVLAAFRAAVLEMPLAYGVAGGLTAAQRRERRAARLDRRTAAAA